MNRDEAIEFVEKIRYIAIEMQNMPDLDEVIAAVPELEQELLEDLRSIHIDSITREDFTPC
jgi:hypothetical protein